MIARGLDNTALMVELKFYQIREPLIDSPEQQVDTYLALLSDRNQKDTRELNLALRDAKWLMSPEAKMSPEIRGKAFLVTGLAQRNQQQFDKAKESLQLAVKEAAVVKIISVKKAEPWGTQAKLALDELTDATVYYLPLVSKFEAAGKFQAALAELNTALLAMPGDTRLLARRALVRFELTRNDPKYSASKFPEDADKAIRADLELALADPNVAGEAAFVQGQLEEVIGNFTRAEALYRQSLKTYKGTPEEISRVRLALGRLLQRDRTPGGAPAALPQSKLNDEPSIPTEKAEVVYVHPLSLLVAQLALGAQPGAVDDDDPAETARIKESVEIAKDLMKSDNPKIKGQGNMLMGQALAKQGRRTEGLRLYIEGLKLVFPGRETKELMKLVEEHPIFQLPDVATRPNPYLAEYHYAQGRQLYFARKYTESEAHLKQAVTYFDQDARYHYFLGLTQIAQRTRFKRDLADLSLIRAGKLEAQNKPNFTEVNMSLERIQGDLRQFLNRYRVGGINAVDLK